MPVTTQQLAHWLAATNLDQLGFVLRWADFIAGALVTARRLRDVHLVSSWVRRPGAIRLGQIISITRQNLAARVPRLQLARPSWLDRTICPTPWPCTRAPDHDLMVPAEAVATLHYRRLLASFDCPARSRSLRDDEMITSGPPFGVRYESGYSAACVESQANGCSASI